MAEASSCKANREKELHSKNDTVVKMSLPEDNTSILASQYQLYLPSQEQLKAEVETLRRLTETSGGHSDS